MSALNPPAGAAAIGASSSVRSARPPAAATARPAVGPRDGAAGLIEAIDDKAIDEDAAAAASTASIAAQADESAAKPPALLPVDVRSLSLAVLAILGVVFMLRWAAPMLIPLLLGATLSYALAPVVRGLERLRVPRPAAAGLVVASLVGALGLGAAALRDDVTMVIESMPEAAQKIRRAVRAGRDDAGGSPLDKVQQAAAQIEQAGNEATPSAPRPSGVTRVQIEKRKFDLNEYLWSSTPKAVAVIGQTTIVILLACFILGSGDSLRRKMAKIAGPSFARRKITVQGMDEITEQVQRYLLVQVLVSVVVGVATWLAYAALGIAQPAVWGVAAGLLNLVPYLGSIAISVASALAGFVQFGSLDMALLVGSVATVLHLTTGYLLTPWLTSKASRLSALSVFVSLIVFGWLWGFWGLLLGVPVLMMVKAVSDRIEELKPLGELLGR